MYSAATTVDEYLDEMPEDRRASMETLRKVILDNISEGYEEIMQFGMIGYVIPLERYPVTYNGQALQAVALCSQKNYMSLYLMNVYGDQNSRSGSRRSTGPAARSSTWGRPAYASRSRKTCQWI